MKTEHFVDFVRVHVKAGDGGAGAVAFRREKYVPEGGPAGGHGGAGGDIYFEGDLQMTTLLDFKMRPLIKAQKGANGGNFNCAGRSGEDVVIKVPLGTSVVDADTNEEIGDLTRDGQRIMAAKGGRGGLGNESFATATRRTPLHAQDGEAGQERNLILELKIIADVGLVGLPNAGKSTLLSRITNAHPKIAPYPFTTLNPNLGILTDEAMEKVVTLADIPGLIEGAHKGAGLGDRFLRHIERTRLLVHLVSPESGADDPKDAAGRKLLAEDLYYAYHLVEEELAQYSATMAEKPRIGCLNKTDRLSAVTVRRILKEFAKHNIELLPVSAVEGDGLGDLMNRIFSALEAMNPAAVHAPSEAPFMELLKTGEESKPADSAPAAEPAKVPEAAEAASGQEPPKKKSPKKSAARKSPSKKKTTGQAV